MVFLPVARWPAAAAAFIHGKRSLKLERGHRNCKDTQREGSLRECKDEEVVKRRYTLYMATGLHEEKSADALVHGFLSSEGADAVIDGFLIKCYSEKGADDDYSAPLLDGEVEVDDVID